MKIDGRGNSPRPLFFGERASGDRVLERGMQAVVVVNAGWVSGLGKTEIQMFGTVTYNNP
ncbi:hypothetical protein [Occallatibacter savannae]|uniref:hypothetical protein n=1 Tax=Occallatibacter savannae TaxID=1002691 RepID=UPI000D69A939|nr:hypothetical protein [Occallatibacter savannae]